MKDDILYQLILQAVKSINLLATYYEHSQFNTQDQEDIIIVDESQLNNASGNNQKELIDMPPKYADGSFRPSGNKGLLQYRFMYNKQQVHVYGYSKQECWQKRENYKPKQKQKTINKPANNNIILLYKNWTDIWLTEKQNHCKQGYFNAIVMYLKNDILPNLGNIDIKKITTEELQLFLQRIKSDNKRTKIGAILSESIRRAYELQKIPFNVFLGVRYKKYQSPHKNALTHKEQLMLLENIKDTKLLTLTKLLLLTDIRQGEALALSPEDISNNVIRINKSFNKTTQSISTPKTKSSVRTIPINSELLELLRPYIKKNQRLFTYDNDFLSKTYSNIFKKLKIKATGHTLRHTFITNAYEIGVPAHIVQRWAGHAKAEQADTYLDLRNSKDFIQTDIINYMIKLKDKYVPKILY